MIYEFRKSQLERIVMVSFKPEQRTVSFMLDDGTYLNNAQDSPDFRFGSEYFAVELLISSLMCFIGQEFEAQGKTTVEGKEIHSWRKKENKRLSK